MLTLSEIRKLLSKVPNLHHNADLSFRYLAQGISNESYYVAMHGMEYALRIYNPDATRIGLNRENEFTIMDQVRLLELCPKSIFYSPEHNFCLTRWLDGQTWNRQQLENPPCLKHLVQRLKQLHSLPCHHLPKLDLLERLDRYRLMIQQRHGKLPTIELQLLSSAHDLIESMQPLLPPCLCHNDLMAANILAGNLNNEAAIYFLDWEYAAVNDPLFELAVFCRGNQLSVNNQQYLLQTYFGDKKILFDKDFATWCWFYDYLSFLWALVIIPEDAPLPVNLSLALEQLQSQLPKR